MSKTDWIQQEIEALQAQGLYNRIRTIESPQGAWLKVDGKRVLNFCSNNYLGLANHPDIVAAAKKSLDALGIGPAAVRSIAGTMTLHVELEKRLAQFKGVEAAITFQSGFTANLATIPALVGKEDVIFSDRLNHASIIDGCRLSGAKIIAYEHNDVKSLEEQIQANLNQYRRALIVTDGVFSMDGDIAPLPDICEVAKKHDILLMVDDAHGEGVLGNGGRGIVDHFGLHGKVDVEIGTMSKAFGVVGGMVAGNKVIVEWLRQRGRPFLFSSAVTVPDAAACLAAIDLLEDSTQLVDKLWDNAKYFKAEMKNLGFDTGVSETPITPIMLGEAKLAQEFSRGLFEEGVFAMALGYPTVPQGKARIRVMISAAHSQDDLDKGLEAFAKVGKRLGVIR
ncbi:MAG: 2-amino-3-ketobutyrate CoA ligase [Anaerolineaceae bacterium]|nr:glycine C-acetyltransferase [Chloroflexota bacterium]GJQ40339.1 MAG: 2-amino-3-ketobutyrate CoA ligase [Anaerolineaceae bacterium]HMM99111.1 glycine C-acetyltransferase [Anaerolineales bacterium]NOG75852.1 glycine C-acetyltransferase [Chloroflexota bacterium]GIK09812.1 MAG: 2-amino-3-ketobutyrate CoA ligase [Chloroflexota bacterium]